MKEKENVLFVKVPKMDKCGIGNLYGKDCGSATVKGTVFTEYQALSDCQRDITRHIYTFYTVQCSITKQNDASSKTHDYYTRKPVKSSQKS